ncbi:GspH/FimT family pseudopilin [Vreelandella sp. GE22]
MHKALLSHHRRSRYASAQAAHDAHRDRGMTFLELVVALFIMGLLTTGALPHLQALNQRTALKGEINRFQRAFSLARNTAITRRETVTLCPVTAAFRCSDDWSLPLAVIDGAPRQSAEPQRILRIFPAHPKSRITYNRQWRQVRYTPLGHASGYNGSFKLCSGANAGKELVLSQLGRLRVDSASVPCADP